MPKVSMIPADPEFPTLSRKVSDSVARSRPESLKMQVFTLGDVANILRAPKSRIKNWTIGRPLKIVPKVLAGHGKGSRSLYSLEDVYLFALVNQLNSDGLSSRVIQYVVDAASATPRLGPVKFFVLDSNAGKLQGRFFTTERRWEDIAKSKKRVDATACSGTYVLNVEDLVAWVNHRVAKLRERK